MKTLKIFVATLAMALYFTSAQADSDAVNNAQNLYGDGRVDSAISTLVSYVEYGQVSDHKAYKLIATWSFEKGQYTRSARYYSMLLDSKNASLSKAMTSRSKVANQFKAKFNSAYQQGDTTDAVTLAKATDMIESGFVRQAYYKYLARGKSATNYQKAIDNLKVAGKLASTYDEKRAVANRYIWLTQNHQDEANALYAYAERLVGSSYVDGFRPHIKTDFFPEKTFDNSNVDKEGCVVVDLSTLKGQKGEILIVVRGDVPRDGTKEIHIDDGENWVPLPKGTERTLVYPENTDGQVRIWIDENPSIRLYVKIGRRFVVTPNYSELAML